MNKILLTLSTIILFSACQSTQAWLKTKPENFQQGYNDGCENGEDMASYSYIFKSNNTARYNEDFVYQKAWDEGYEDCYSDKELDNMMKSGRF